MLIRYFSAWNKACHGGDAAPSVFVILGAIWKMMTNRERVLVITLACSFGAVCFTSVFSAFDDVFAFWSYISLACELVLAILAWIALNRGVLLRSSAITSEWIDLKIRAFTKALKVEGITTSEQMKTIQNETVRLIDRKLHRKETFTARAFQLLVTGLLFWSLTFVIELVDHGLQLDAAATLGVIVFAAVIVAMALSGFLWVLYDQADSMSLERLQDFNNDLIRSIIAKEGAENSARTGAARCRRRFH